MCKSLTPKQASPLCAKVNDRIGKSGRIDLTKTAFAKLAPLSVGLVKVDVEPVSSNQTLSKLSSNAMLPAQIPLDEQPTNMPLVDEINEMLWEESSQKSKPAVATVE